MPYIGKKPADIIATAVDTTTGTFSGAFTSLGIDDNADATAITISSGEVVTLSNNLITNGNVLRGVDNSSNTFSGGTASNSGSNIAVYGSSHSSLANNVRFRNGSTQTMLVDSTGAVTIANGLTLTDGNLVVASGHGIDFSAASNATNMTSELLDDYEEGTWTPTLVDGSGNEATVNSGSTGGTYTKIGRMVAVTGRCTTSSVSGLSSIVYVKNLPFTSLSGQAGYATLAVGQAFNLNITAGQSVELSVSPNDTKAQVRLNDHAAGNTHMSPSEWSDDGYVMFSGVYVTA